MDENIEDVVRNNVPLVHGQSSKGWNSVYCEVCGDGSRTKGPRGGWLFVDDACFYNCFNCGIEGNFDPNREHALSKNMWKIFTSFGIEPKEFMSIAEKGKSSEKKVRKKRTPLPEIPELPDYFKLLSDYSEGNERAKAARQFLWDHYRLTDDDYPFYMSTGKTKSLDRYERYLARSLKSRIIIPAFYREKMIFWQARIFMGESDKKYISASVEHSNNAIYGMDNLYQNIEHPLFVTEGFFDSWHLNGAAIMTNKMKTGKIEILERSPRKKVIVPDLNKDGMNLAEQAIELGWGLSLPSILPETDVCGAILRYGKLYTLKTISENVCFDFEAEYRLKAFRIDHNL